MSLAGMSALRCVPSTNIVGRALPFHRTTELPTKLVPVTVNVNAAPSVGAEVGEVEISVGNGLLTEIVPVLIQVMRSGPKRLIRPLLTSAKKTSRVAVTVMPTVCGI